jgi:hypothetical protein
LKIPTGLIAVTQRGTDNKMFEDIKGFNTVTQRGTDNTMFEDTIGFNSCNSKRNRQYNV